MIAGFQHARLAIAAIVLCSFVIAMRAHAGPTDISDVPMAVKNLVAPNIMFMLDNSGSMSNIVPDSSYADGAGGSCGSATILGGGAAEPAFPPNDVSIDVRIVNGQQKIYRGKHLTWGTDKDGYCFDPKLRYNARLNADASCGGEKCPSGYLDAVYKGDYLNWYFSGAPFGTEATRKPGTTTRMEVAKAAVKTVLDSLAQANVRVGLSTYNGADGGALAQAMGSLSDSAHKKAMSEKINDLKPRGNTPLAETLADIGRYFTTGYAGDLTIHPNQPNQRSVTVDGVFKANTGGSRDGWLKDSANAAAPIESYCQGSFAVLMTDGQPNGDQQMSEHLVDYKGECAANPKICLAGTPGGGDGASNNFGRKVGRSYEAEGSDYLDDVAAALYEIDLRPDLRPAKGEKKRPNNVRTYTIGFADEQAKADPLMQAAADAGHGLFRTARNPEELVQAFKAATEDILGQDGGAAAVAVANVSIKDDNASYVSGYNSGSWTGDLVAYRIDLATGKPDVTKPIWTQSAQTALDRTAFDERKIASYTGRAGANQGIRFRPAGGKTTLSDAQQALLNSPDKTDGAAVVKYLRGDRSGDGSTYRKRAALLGDIINAEPVIVGPPAAVYGDDGYGAFKAKAKDRTRIILQGANDGMLHAFDSATGREEWAYVPGLLMSSLNNLSRQSGFVHKYYVDATPVAHDVDFSRTMDSDSATPDWRTIAVGGLGKGGRGYYALDVTTTQAANEEALTSKVLWEFPNSETLDVAKNVGFTFGRPILSKTKAAGWVVLVTSGYNNGEDTGGDGRGYLFVLNPRTGAVINAISTGVGTKATPSGLAHISGYADLGSLDNTVEYVYGGDLLGNLWRFDFTGATTDSWKAVQLASLVVNKVPQPITTEPELAKVNIGGGVFKRFVYVGTGLYLGDSDVLGVKAVTPNDHASQTQSMYGLVDDLSAFPGAITRSTLQEQSFTVGANQNRTVTSNAMDFAAKDGWYIDLPVTGERINSSPSLALGVLAFTSNIPSSVPCVPGGSSYFNVLDYRTGGAVEKEGLASIYLGEVLASRAVLERLPREQDTGSSSGGSSSGSGGSSGSSSGGRSGCLNVKGLIRTSDGGTLAEKVPPCGGAAIVQRRSWRELMR